ncbi:MAG: hypothetical protein JXA16_04205 [Bacteroidales bacterium]|nr:hypothetical protein [Bacteroidales bacterium]
MVKKILIVISVIILLFVAFIAYSGFFANVEITEKEVGPYFMVGKEYLGDYKNSGTHQDSIYKDLVAKDVTIEAGFGIYRDNPKEVKAEELRSMLGCIVNEKDTVKKTELEREGYIIQKMGVTKSAVVEFPFKNTFSIIASVIKVYPKLEEYFITNKYQKVPALEIYKDNKIIISMEIIK